MSANTHITRNAPANERPGYFAVAAAITLIIHIGVTAGVIWGKWLETPIFSQTPKPQERLVTVRLVPDEKPTPPRKVFVPVNPANATKQAPKETENYSNANSIAANSEPSNKPTPNIRGEQQAERRAHADDASAASQQLATKPKAPRPQSARPVTPPKTNPIKPKPHDHPQPSLTQSAQSGGLSPLQPFNPPNFSSALPEPAIEPERRLPPSLTEAQANLGKGTLAGRSTSLEGGVQRKGPHALDVRLTGFGEYDARFLATIKAKWYELLEGRKLRYPGIVKVDFILHSDGRITQLKVRENTITNLRAKPIQEYCCRQSISGSALFEQWPEAMREKLKSDSRNCRITFHYIVR